MAEKLEPPVYVAVREAYEIAARRISNLWKNTRKQKEPTK